MAVGVGQPGPGGTRIVMPIGFFFIGRISPTCPYSSRGTCAAAPRPMSKREGRGADGGPRGWPLLPPAPHTASAHRVGVAAVDEHPRVDEHEQPPEEDHPARAARRARRGGDGGGGAESRGARAGACLGDTRQKVVMAPSSGTHDMACAFVGMSKIRSARVAYSLAYTHGGVRTCGQRPHAVWAGAARALRAGARAAHHGTLVPGRGLGPTEAARHPLLQPLVQHLVLGQLERLRAAKRGWAEQPVAMECCGRGLLGSPSSAPGCHCRSRTAT